RSRAATSPGSRHIIGVPVSVGALAGIFRPVVFRPPPLLLLLLTLLLLLLLCLSSFAAFSSAFFAALSSFLLFCANVAFDGVRPATAKSSATIKAANAARRISGVRVCMVSVTSLECSQMTGAWGLSKISNWQKNYEDNPK